MPLFTPPRSGGEVSHPGGSGDPKGSWREKAEADTGASAGERGSWPAALGGRGRAVLASELLLCSALGPLPWTPDPQLLRQQPLTEGVMTVPASLGKPLGPGSGSGGLGLGSHLLGTDPPGVGATKGEPCGDPPWEPGLRWGLQKEATLSRPLPQCPDPDF